MTTLIDGLLLGLSLVIAFSLGLTMRSLFNISSHLEGIRTELRKIRKHLEK